jgi:hypothetical protein
MGCVKTSILLVLSLALLSAVALGPATRPSAVAPVDDDVRALARGLTGSFNSKAQSEADSSYFNVLLHMVPIWTDRTDGIWLYVEQAMSTTPDAPYRQRVYRVLRRDDGKLVSEVYLLPGSREEVLKYAGAWKSDKPLDGLTPDKLISRAGCEMILSANPDGSFKGGTQGKNCPSELNGAAYATSEAEVLPRQLRTWDRGFNSSDTQVWGAKKGPYIFDREK